MRKCNWILSRFDLRSRGSSANTVSDYGLDDRRSIPTEAEDFSSSFCVQTGSGAHPASCPMGTGGSFPGGKARPGRDADHSQWVGAITPPPPAPSWGGAEQLYIYQIQFNVSFNIFISCLYSLYCVISELCNGSNETAGRCGVDWAGSGSREHRNEPSGSINGAEFFTSRATVSFSRTLFRS
jgi:hypothetical protein